MLGLKRVRFFDACRAACADDTTEVTILCLLLLLLSFILLLLISPAFWVKVLCMDFIDIGVGDGTSAMNGKWQNLSRITYRVK